MTPRPLHLSRLALPALAALALLGAWPAHAVGRLADIQLQDRDSGETLSVIRHRGEYWVAGRPGARYAVAVRNRSGGRVLGVVSVDGVNVISGETAAWAQTGYVLGPWQAYAITGWRKSDSEVAAFHFTASPASYAARTGRPDHMGVIGVAVFREKTPPPPPPAVISPRERFESDGASSAADRMGESRAAPAPLSQAPSGLAKSESERSDAAPAQESANAARRMAPAAPRLGTGHGAREGSWVGHTTFERRSDEPDELIRIRYDSLANLIAMGIVPASPTPPRPNPFPGGVQPGYAPDPN